MSEANKKLVREMFERVWNGEDAPSVVKATRAEDAVSRGLGAESLRNQDEYLSFVHLVKSVLKETRVEVHETIAERDLVSMHATLRGKTYGGKPVTVMGIGIVKVENGKVVQAWNSWDGLALQAQLGVTGATSIEGVLRFAAKQST